ncbi:hypothetical protein FNV43_RR00957 [Rhamnella rubrinervis]|uniref:MPN domain-containing protein n=1 Tax=Rhamnella rubrinervis TaxID=2594499 RepID=A0A8K0MRV3_9ROSA|nr:hypothetical protein FNV43_RR00957 [Rhamnella rubrinervis]
MALTRRLRFCVLAAALVPITVFCSISENAEEEVPKIGGAGIVQDPAQIVAKALLCFNDKHIYSSCEESYRLNESGKLGVPLDKTDAYCNGPCLTETHLVLDCVDNILTNFLFYNKASIQDVRDTIQAACGDGPERGNFNVAEHIQAKESNANQIVVGLGLMVIMGFVGLLTCLSNRVGHKSKSENGAFCFSSLTRLDVLNPCSTLNNVLVLRRIHVQLECRSSGIFSRKKKMKINVNSMARKVEVDNRIPLRNYYRIAENLLKQASIYREENNIVDLYIMLLRFSSLVSETIPDHRDYQVVLPKERVLYRKKLMAVIDELESLKPEFNRQVSELDKAHARTQLPQLDGPEKTSYSSWNSSLEWPAVNKRLPSINSKQPVSVASQSSWKYNNDQSSVSSISTQFDKQFQKLSIKPVPNKETLSRHSFLGPNGLRGQWLGPRVEIKVNYPSSTDLNPTEIPTESSSLNQAVVVKDGNSGGIQSTMDSVLSLDDGRWQHPAEDSSSSFSNEAQEDLFQLIHQPSPPPVLARVQPELQPIPPSKVADPRPGPAKPSQDGMQTSNSYQHLHIPVKMMDDFLRLARANTDKNLETCGVLAGSLKNRVFHITTLIIPKQESTSDSCQTLNEEEIFEVQDSLSLFPLGWIHTHPSQTCFMSSVDLHTHYSYQIMLPEAIAIVMAPTDTSCPHGIFHLSDPGGVAVIRNCEQRGFHPHEEPSDGSPIYEHCSHVYMNSNLKFDVVDLR